MGSGTRARLHRMVRRRIDALLHLHRTVAHAARDLPEPGLAGWQVVRGGWHRADGKKKQSGARSANSSLTHGVLLLAEARVFAARLLKKSVDAIGFPGRPEEAVRREAEAATISRPDG